MHRSECFAAGGFKINGPPRVGKGPMGQGNNLGVRDEASLPQPTQAGRIKQCTKLIRQATKCLENNDKDCVTRLIEELIKANCHDGRIIGKEITNEVRKLAHELWLVNDDGSRCELLRMLRGLGVLKSWVAKTLGMNMKKLDKWLTRYGIDWERKIMRNDIVKEIEDLLRRLGWSEVGMCEELWRFVGVDVDEFRRHGIEPCAWLEGLESLRDLRRPY